MSEKVIYNPCAECATRESELCGRCRLTLAEKAYKGLHEDAKRNYLDLCAICAHSQEANEKQCDLECLYCKDKCTCHACRNGSEWRWQGECQE